MLPATPLPVLCAPICPNRQSQGSSPGHSWLAQSRTSGVRPTLANQEAVSFWKSLTHLAQYRYALTLQAKTSRLASVQRVRCTACRPSCKASITLMRFLSYTVAAVSNSKRLQHTLHTCSVQTSANRYECSCCCSLLLFK